MDAVASGTNMEGMQWVTSYGGRRIGGCGEDLGLWGCIEARRDGWAQWDAGLRGAAEKGGRDWWMLR